MDVLRYIEKMKEMYEGERIGPRTMAQEPRNMAHGGQLVAPSVDGSRPGYGGVTKFILKQFVKQFKIKNPFKIPTQTEILKATGAGSKKIKNLLNEGTDFIVTPPKDVATAAGLKGGAKMKEIAGSVSEVSSDLRKEVKDIDVKGISVSIEPSTYGSQFIRLRFTDNAIKIFGKEWLPATKENLKKIKTKIKKIENSPEYKNVEPFKTEEYFRKLNKLKKARYKKQDPFRIYEKLQAYKTEKFPGTLSSDIQIQHGQPKFDTQTLSRWGLIPEKVQSIPAVVRAERIRNKLLSSALVKLKNPKRSIADKKKIIEEFNDTMKGLRGHLKGTEGQGLVNFELLKIDDAGNITKLKDVGFDPNKGLAYGEELGQLDLAKISQEQADQIIALGKKKIDLELLRQVLPSKLKNIVNPLSPSRYYEAGGRVGFQKGKGVLNKIRKLGKWTAWGLAAEPLWAAPFAGYEYLSGESPERMLGTATWGLFGETEKEELKKAAGERGYGFSKLENYIEKLGNIEQSYKNFNDQNDPGGRERLILEHWYDKVGKKYNKTLELFTDESGEISEDLLNQAQKNLLAGEKQIEKFKKQLAGEREQKRIETAEKYILPEGYDPEDPLTDDVIRNIKGFAGGGMAGIRKPSAIAPTRGPMHQGLASTSEYDTYSKEYKWQT